MIIALETQLEYNLRRRWRYLYFGPSITSTTDVGNWLIETMQRFILKTSFLYSLLSGLRERF